AEHASHELGLVAREVVVDGDEVDTLALEGVEIGRQRGDERLALTGLHLGDVAEVERRATHDLDVEVTLAERAPRRLTYRGEGLGEDVVERLACGDPLPEPVGLLAQLSVGQRREALFEGTDLSRDAV